MTTATVIGAVLAGGRSLRMNGRDKRFLEDGKATLLQASIARAAPQVDRLILCTHNDQPETGDLTLPIVRDLSERRIGPAAGIISAFTWLQQQPVDFRWLATFPCDTPAFPETLVASLLAAAHHSDFQAVVPVAGANAQYAFALWSTACLAEVAQQIEAGEYSLKAILKTKRTYWLELEQAEGAFFNINTPEDWQQFLAHNLPP